jgi:Mg2+/Co2+ transporter CorB
MMDIRNTVTFSVHRYALSQRLRLEVTGCKRQAHHSHGSKNNENDMLHGVTSFSDMTVEPILLSFSALLTAHPLPYVWPAIEELDTALFTGI